MRCFATVVTKSHVGPVLAVSHSLRNADNAELLHVLIADATAGELPPAPAGMVFHSLDEVREALPELMPYYFDAFEFCNALKPFLISLLLSKGCEAVIYLDSDIFVVGSFEPVWKMLEQNTVVLTPHLLRPPSLDLRFIDEVSVVDQGIYNGGFSAWANKPRAVEALEWMKQRLPVYGFCRRPNGMFVDQKLLPFLPEYYPDEVLIARDGCLNIAFWNMQERHVAVRNGRYFIDDEPVVFFHMSGYRTAKPDLACSYMSPEINRQMFELAPWFREVMRDYGRLLADTQSGAGAPREPYKFARYAGFELNAPLRMILFKKGKLSWRDPEVWKVLLVERLRLIKRWIWSWFK